jgi:hypothetical protein
MQKTQVVLISDQKRRSKIKSSDVSLPVNTAVFDALIRCEVRVLSQNDLARKVGGFSGLADLNRISDDIRLTVSTDDAEC